MSLFGCLIFCPLIFRAIIKENIMIGIFFGAFVIFKQLFVVIYKKEDAKSREQEQATCVPPLFYEN